MANTAMSANLKRLWVLILLAALCSIQGCNGCRIMPGTHRQFSRSEAKQQLLDHEHEFEALANDWTAHHRDGKFVLDAAKNAPLDGLSPPDMPALAEQCRKLGIAEISVKRRAETSEGEYVQFGLQEVGADYGYLYVPQGHADAQTRLNAAAKNAPYLIDMERVEQIAPEWFYFEGKGAL
jgi:hypothetical protein